MRQFFNNDLDCIDFDVKFMDATPLYIIAEDGLDNWLTSRSDSAKQGAWCQANSFTAKTGQVLAMSNDDGSLQCLLLGADDGRKVNFSSIWQQIPAGSYYLPVDGSSLINDAPDEILFNALSWAGASYNFIGNDKANAKVLLLDPAISPQVSAHAVAEYAVRDLVNTPANIMHPEALAAAAANLAKKFGADFKQIVGDELLNENYPAIHAVGNASEFAPRLLDISWGDDSYPQLVLVGKGVCFDSGGLDIKSTAGMRQMKKDMAGAAHVLGLAYLIMQAKLPVSLRVLIPAVENAVGSRAYRPGDVLTMRNGDSIEISNTDAEGRLVLADALASVNTKDTDLVIDIATLTGAARIAVGPDIVPYFSSNHQIAVSLQSSAVLGETLMQMPLYEKYNRYLKSNVAKMKNAAEQPFAGTITAALFLQNFIGEVDNWLHFDIYAWQEGAKDQAGVQAIYSLFSFISQRYSD